MSEDSYMMCVRVTYKDKYGVAYVHNCSVWTTPGYEAEDANKKAMDLLQGKKYLELNVQYGTNYTDLF